ncbi:hypothetical protein GLOIN_2v1629452 [Rhizophagus irregularis DAOM 181602=DAOM 197198]|uniref:Uncharacterized protein n=1 Tax=Rhizophagus irregularis (strain DAOM 181602 / DAOM 197198 / MUCL 43194) TaxID=747089 RepID=A0A2P4PV55_RHIID|nr:hypothetical protein GLOIN_2v1629452 [Rhizophagus irregularis DAOM 181602=DAOM 197198]POG69256.1 hypothetical protein GLOIN_2v1629452 [Rhizophagus irregularis DAOM 181602=DAOM 197198]|eukprot:XP_025176122.1 hypothetical protein GLOIN_2v1629452 [Rhizophagus irregularis DAOM 181602=DAOM 197198]
MSLQLHDRELVVVFQTRVDNFYMKIQNEKVNITIDHHFQVNYPFARIILTV